MTYKDKFCELCAFVVLEPHQVLVWITDRSPRYTNTYTRQNRTFFHNESQNFWRFSCITCNKAKTKNAKLHVVALDACDVAFNLSPLRLVSSFWHTVHLCLAMQYFLEFIWVNLRWNGPTWEAKTIISYFTINSGLNSQPLSSASQECRFATNQRLKMSNLRHYHISNPSKY